MQPKIFLNLTNEIINVIQSIVGIFYLYLVFLVKLALRSEKTINLVTFRKFNAGIDNEEQFIKKIQIALCQTTYLTKVRSILT